MFKLTKLYSTKKFTITSAKTIKQVKINKESSLLLKSQYQLFLTQSPDKPLKSPQILKIKDPDKLKAYLSGKLSSSRSPDKQLQLEDLEELDIYNDMETEYEEAVDTQNTSKTVDSIVESSKKRDLKIEANLIPFLISFNAFLEGNPGSTLVKSLTNEGQMNLIIEQVQKNASKTLEITKLKHYLCFFYLLKKNQTVYIPLESYQATSRNILRLLDSFISNGREILDFISFEDLVDLLSLLAVNTNFQAYKYLKGLQFKAEGLNFLFLNRVFFRFDSYVSSTSHFFVFFRLLLSDYIKLSFKQELRFRVIAFNNVIKSITKAPLFNDTEAIVDLLEGIQGEFTQEVALLLDIDYDSLAGEFDMKFIHRVEEVRFVAEWIIRALGNLSTNGIIQNSYHSAERIRYLTSSICTAFIGFAKVYERVSNENFIRFAFKSCYHLTRVDCNEDSIHLFLDLLERNLMQGSSLPLSTKQADALVCVFSLMQNCRHISERLGLKVLSGLSSLNSIEIKNQDLVDDLIAFLEEIRNRPECKDFIKSLIHKFQAVLDQDDKFAFELKSKISLNYKILNRYATLSMLRNLINSLNQEDLSLNYTIQVVIDQVDNSIKTHIKDKLLFLFLLLKLYVRNYHFYLSESDRLTMGSYFLSSLDPADLARLKNSYTVFRYYCYLTEVSISLPEVDRKKLDNLIFPLRERIRTDDSLLNHYIRYLNQHAPSEVLVFKIQEIIHSEASQADFHERYPACLELLLMGIHYFFYNEDLRHVSINSVEFMCKVVDLVYYHRVVNSGSVGDLYAFLSFDLRMTTEILKCLMAKRLSARVLCEHFVRLLKLFVNRSSNRDDLDDEDVFDIERSDRVFIQGNIALILDLAEYTKADSHIIEALKDLH